MRLRTSFTFLLTGLISGILISLFESIYYTFPFSTGFKYTGFFYGMLISFALLFTKNKISVLKHLFFILFSGLGFIAATLSFSILWNHNIQYGIVYSLPGILGLLVMFIGFRRMFALNALQVLLILSLSGTISYLFASNFNPIPNESAAFLFLKSPYSILIIGWQAIIGACLGFIVENKQAIEKPLLSTPTVEQKI